MESVNWQEVDLGDGQVVLAVLGEVDGQEGFLVLDTGCTTTCIRELHEHPGGGEVALYQMPDGEPQELYLAMATVRVGTKTMQLQTGVLAELPFFSAFAQEGTAGLLGLLGNDWMRYWGVSLDFEGKRIEFP